MFKELKNEKKAQVSVEFMSIIGAVLFVFIVIIIIVFQQRVEVDEQKELLLVDDLAKSIQKEVLIAAAVNNGYSRQFSIPASVDRYNFTLINSDKELVITTGNYDISKKIPKIYGNFTKGLNTIQKVD